MLSNGLKTLTAIQKKYNHHPLFDSWEVVVKKGIVKELLPFTCDRWQSHKLTFMEKYGMDIPTILERYPNYKNLLDEGLISNLQSWG